MKNLTVKMVEAQLRKLAAERPDFVYSPKTQITPPCFYNKGPKDGPESDGCIFGQALQALGVPKTALKSRRTIDALWASTHKEVAPPASWLRVQRLQDSGSTWGEAIKVL